MVRNELLNQRRESVDVRVVVCLNIVVDSRFLNRLPRQVDAALFAIDELGVRAEI